jgi:hypothetical protein
MTDEQNQNAQGASRFSAGLGITDSEKRLAWKYSVEEGLKRGVSPSNNGFDPFDLYLVTVIYEQTCNAIKLTKYVMANVELRGAHEKR